MYFVNQILFSGPSQSSVANVNYLVFSNWSWCLVHHWKRFCWSRLSLYSWYIDFCYHWWDRLWIWRNIKTVLDIIFVWASFATGKNDAKELDRMGMFNFSAAAVIIHIMVKPIQENWSKDPTTWARTLNGSSIPECNMIRMPLWFCQISVTLLI